MFSDLELLETEIDGGQLTNGDNHDDRDGPLTVLRPSTLKLLSSMLNPIKVIPTYSGLSRDWRGIAELAGLTAENITYVEGKSDQTQELIKILPSLSTSRLKTIKDLKAFLAIIDRFDIVDDGEPLLDNDIAVYRSRLGQLASKGSKHPPSLDTTNDRDLLTYGDVNGETTRYDAFILNADEDIEFANEVVRKLETEYNLRICVKDRDLLPGVMFEHEAIGKLIEARCNRLLVILSPSFLESEGNKFLVSFTQALALESRQRKIIPCMYKRCDLPFSVRYSFTLDYNRAGTLWNFWEKLSNSIITTPKIGPMSELVNESTPSPISTSIKTATSLPDYSQWNSKKEEGLASSLDLLSLSNSRGPSLPSSLPQYSAKSSKKWYSKVINSAKKKKKEKHSAKKVLANAD